MCVAQLGLRGTEQRQIQALKWLSIAKEERSCLRSGKKTGKTAWNFGHWRGSISSLTFVKGKLDLDIQKLVLGNYNIRSRDRGSFQRVQAALVATWGISQGAELWKWTWRVALGAGEGQGYYSVGAWRTDTGTQDSPRASLNSGGRLENGIERQNIRAFPGQIDFTSQRDSFASSASKRLGVRYLDNKRYCFVQAALVSMFGTRSGEISNRRRFKGDCIQSHSFSP